MRYTKATLFIISGVITIIGIFSVVTLFGDPVSKDAHAEINFDDKISIDEVNRLIVEKRKSMPSENIFYFGFDLRNGPLEDARNYLPFLSYLNQTTGYDFRLRFIPKNTSIIDQLGTGQISIAALGAVSFIKAREKYGAVSLARGLNTIWKTQYRSIIVVAKNSPIKKISDLKGKRFAFGSLTSTQGHLIPRIMMQKQGLSLKDLGSYTYTGSHKKCALAVIQGNFDACGMQDTLAVSLIKSGELEALEISGLYPSSGIAANINMPKKMLEKIIPALINFQPSGRDRDGLYDWQQTEMPNGFGPALATDYDALRNWLYQFGMLKAEQKKSERVPPQ